jgi:(1->4)-alpha-D-glucan 1-alpha-D-glucosylmutase
MLNSLSMTLLKLASPGVPDIYQGNETRDLSLVDPDNRRPIDYVARARVLDELAALDSSRSLPEKVRSLAASQLDGRAKTWLIRRVLAYRRSEPALFERGAYAPLAATGARSEHVIAFLRHRGNRAYIAIAGRLWMKLGTEEGKLPLGEAAWGDTTVDAGPLTGPLTNVLTGEVVDVRAGRIGLSEAFRSFPAALLSS